LKYNEEISPLRGSWLERYARIYKDDAATLPEYAYRDFDNFIPFDRHHLLIYRYFYGFNENKK